jgi:hypothetical protein
LRYPVRARPADEHDHARQPRRRRRGRHRERLSADPAISADGRFVAFDSIASNLHPDDGDDTQDVFRRDVLGAAEQQAAAISIADASLTEGDSGQTAFPFTVSLAPSPHR